MCIELHVSNAASETSWVLSPGQILTFWEEEKLLFHCFMEVLGPFLPLEALNAIYQISFHRKKIAFFCFEISYQVN